MGMWTVRYRKEFIDEGARFDFGKAGSSMEKMFDKYLFCYLKPRGRCCDLLKRRRKIFTFIGDYHMLTFLIQPRPRCLQSFRPTRLAPVFLVITHSTRSHPRRCWR